MTAVLHRPTYLPADCTVGVVHIGVGAFHRAHQAMFFDRLLHQSGAQNWALAGVNLLPAGGTLLEQLRARDYRYVLKTIDPEGASTYREIASIRELVDRITDPAAAAALLARPSVQLVTMTVTETGYFLDEDGQLLKEGVIAAELNDEQGTSVYGYLREGLNARRQTTAGPITLMCCDNLRSNGKHLHSGLTQYLAACGDNELLAWLTDNVTFPSTMVDRITPVPTAEHSADVTAQFGLVGDATVMAEDFVQWVVEDNFAGAKPPLAVVGVQVCEDVFPYEETKIRLLNGSHVTLAFQAALRGIVCFEDAIADPELSDFYDRYINEEVIVALGDNGINDLATYRDQVKRRFANPHLRDTVERICKHGCDKIKVFIMPTIADLLDQGKVAQHGITAIAHWYLFLRAVANGKIGFDYEDPQWSTLANYLPIGQEKAFASSAQLWGELPTTYPQFSTELEDAIVSFTR